MRNSDMHFTALLLPFVLAWLLPGSLVAQDASDSDSSSEVITGDHVVEAGSVVEDLLVVGGDLTVRGRVTGDAVVIGGDLILADGGSVLGDASVTGGTFIDEGGLVDGEMRTIDGRGIDIAGEIQRAVGAVGGMDEMNMVDGHEEAVERRREGRVARVDREEERGPIRKGLGGIVSTIALAVVLVGIGTGLVFYGRANLETVSDTVRGATLRAAGTGLAATFVAVPAFVVLVVALAVSIVGIPLLLLAVPLYPLALFAAFVFGLLSVAHAIGERTSEQSGGPIDLRYRNSYSYMLTGVAMMMLPLLAASLIGMTGFLGFIAVLLKVVTYAAIWACCTVGLGGVILSRGGTRRSFVPAAPDVNFDADDLFDEPLGGRSDHV